VRVSYVYLLGPSRDEYYQNDDVQIFTRTEQESRTSYLTGLGYCMGNRSNNEIHDQVKKFLNASMP